MPTKKITTLSMIISLSVIGRIYFTFIPNVQPVTAIIVITSAIVGIRAGVIVASLTIVVSNLYIGFGIWTIPQVVTFSIIAIIGGSIGKFFEYKSVYLLSAFGFISGYLFGLVMSLYNYIVFGVFWGYYLAGITFDTNHAIGNLFMVLVLHKPLKIVFENGEFEWSYIQKRETKEKLP